MSSLFDLARLVRLSDYLIDFRIICSAFGLFVRYILHLENFFCVLANVLTVSFEKLDGDIPTRNSL